MRLTHKHRWRQWLTKEEEEALLDHVSKVDWLRSRTKHHLWCIYELMRVGRQRAREQEATKMEAAE